MPRIRKPILKLGSAIVFIIDHSNLNPYVDVPEGTYVGSIYGFNNRYDHYIKCIAVINDEEHKFELYENEILTPFSKIDRGQ